MLTTTILASSLLLLIPSMSKKTRWLFSTLRLIFCSFISIHLIYSPITSPSYLSYQSTMDSIRAPLVLLTFWVSALILLARQTTLNNSKSPKWFVFYIIILNLILVLTFSTNNLLLFYIAFERSLIPTLLLILGWGYQPERLQAGIYLMIYTITASLPLLIRLIILTSINNHLSISLQIMPPQLTHSLSTLWWLITLLAFIVKIPLYLVHLWLPKAHVEAPVAGSIILAGILLKLGRYGILRMTYLFQKINYLLTPLISRIALWGACITRLICLRQTDLKSLIAYSSVGHIGLLTAGIISNTSWGWNRALTLIIAHGLCSSALFALANITYESTHTRNLYLTKGLLALFPNLTTLWFIASASNMAAPPSINLIREIILITRSLFSSRILWIPLSVIRFLAAAYSLLLYSSTQHGSPLNYSNPLNLLNPSNYTTIILHLIPLYTLITKPEIITLWL